MRSRDSLFLEFEQLLNLLYPKKGTELWLWKQGGVATAIQSFCRDATATVSRAELHQYAFKNWMKKRGFSARPDVFSSLREMLETEIPLRS